MIACYDLSTCPPTYDVVAFLATAEIERQRRGEPSIDIKILRGPRDGFRADLLWPHTVEERLLMLERVVLPMCRLLPSLASLEVVEPQAYAGQFGYHQYHISLPAIVAALSADCRPLRSSHAWPRSDKLVTITLREAEHHPQRNSNVAVWVEVAERLDKAGYSVAILRDTVNMNQSIGDWWPKYTTWPSASKSLNQRALLYSTAAMNLGVNNGPLWLAIFLNAPVLMYKVTCNALGSCYDDTFYARCGLPRGSQLPCAPNHQRLQWSEDNDPDEIIRVFEAGMVMAYG